MVICLERGADLHMAQLMPLPLTVSCFCKIQIGFIFLVLAHLCSPGKRAIKRVCVCDGLESLSMKRHISVSSGLKTPVTVSHNHLFRCRLWHRAIAALAYSSSVQLFNYLWHLGAPYESRIGMIKNCALRQFFECISVSDGTHMEDCSKSSSHSFIPGRT